ncbi:MAG: hypothetical protein ACR2RB_13780 [Gammaproteobacteria bacterium]
MTAYSFTAPRFDWKSGLPSTPESRAAAKLRKKRRNGGSKILRLVAKNRGACEQVNSGVRKKRKSNHDVLTVGPPTREQVERPIAIKARPELTAFADGTVKVTYK